MLTRAAVGPTDTVLVTGASGGVGSAAVQLACARGAGVVAVTGASKAAVVRDIGRAQAEFQTKAHVGKIVLTLDDLEH